MILNLKSLKWNMNIRNYYSDENIEKDIVCRIGFMRCGISVSYDIAGGGDCDNGSY